MKRLLLSLALIITTAATFAQSIPKMELKPNGFVSAADSTKNYVVLEVPKMKQAKLYKKTLTYLNGLYKNPSQVISAVDGESITVNGYDDGISTIKGLNRYPLSYNVVLQFKDGKIRYQPSATKIEYLLNDKPFSQIYVSNTERPEGISALAIWNKAKDGSYYVLLNLDKAFQ